MKQQQSRLLAEIMEAMQSTNPFMNVCMNVGRPGMEFPAVRYNSCMRCQQYKLKCDRRSPCTNCRRLDVTTRSRCSVGRGQFRFSALSQPRPNGDTSSRFQPSSESPPFQEVPSMGTVPPRLLNLLDSRNLHEYRSYVIPHPSNHPLASSLADSVPDLPGLEFDRDFTDWVLPTANGTHLIVKVIGADHRTDIRDLQVWQRLTNFECQDTSPLGSGDELSAKKRRELRDKEYHDMVKFLDQFNETQTRWRQHFDQEATHRLIGHCVRFQTELIEQAWKEAREMCDIELVVLDALRALALSHQVSEVTRLLDDDNFDDHGYTEPTTLQAPKAANNGKTFEVTKYNFDIHGPISIRYDQPEGSILSSILKHIILTCEEHVNDIRQGPVIAAVIFLLTLVIADLATDVECVNTFDHDKLEEVLAELCLYLESACQGHHPFQKKHPALIYSEQVDPAYELHWWLFDQLNGIWNSYRLWEEYDEETLLMKLRYITFR